MATSFTVILFSRQQFGPDQGKFDSVEPQVAFAGLSKDFSFDCPNVDSGETAVLMFQSLGVGSKATVFQINGVDVYGGLPVANNWDPTGLRALNWSGNIMLVESNHRLKNAGNVLHVESTGLDFIIDNVVITYKTYVRPPRVSVKRSTRAKRSTRD